MKVRDKMSTYSCKIELPIPLIISNEYTYDSVTSQAKPSKSSNLSFSRYNFRNFITKLGYFVCKLFQVFYFKHTT